MSKEKDKVKVLFTGRFNFTEILSGPEKVAKRIFTTYTKSNPSVFISYFFDGKQFGLLKKLLGKFVTKRNNNSAVYTLGLFRIFSIILKTKPDIIHIITYERFAIIFVFFKLFFRYKIFYHSHGLIELGNKINNLSFFYRMKDKICENLFFKYSDKLIFPSDAFVELALKEYNFRKNKITIIPNGIDEIYYCPDVIKGNKGKPLNVILETEKIGFEDSAAFILDALNKIKFPICLNIIGSRYKIFCENDKVKITYFNKMRTDDFAGFLKKNDVFISIIRFDSFSISAAEAMAAGVIPIVNKDIGIANFITNGVNGYKMSYDDSSSLAEYLDILSCDIDKRKLMSGESKKIYNELSWDRVYKEYEKLYFTE